MTDTKGIMLGCRIPLSPGNFLGTGSSDPGEQQGPAKDVAAGYRSWGMVAAARVADRAVVVGVQ